MAEETHVQTVLTNRGIVDINLVHPGDWVFDAIDGSPIVILDSEDTHQSAATKISYSLGGACEFYGSTQKFITKFIMSDNVSIEDGLSPVRRYKSAHVGIALVDRFMYTPCPGDDGFGRIDAHRFEKFDTNMATLVSGLDLVDAYAAGGFLMYGDINESILNISSGVNKAFLSYIRTQYDWRPIESKCAKIMYFVDKRDRYVSWKDLLGVIGFGELSIKNDNLMNKFLFAPDIVRMKFAAGAIDAGFYISKNPYNQSYVAIDGAFDPYRNHDLCRILFSLGTVAEVVYSRLDLKCNIFIRGGEVFTETNSTVRALANKLVYTGAACVNITCVDPYRGMITTCKLIPENNQHEFFLSGNLLPLSFT